MVAVDTDAFEKFCNAVSRVSLELLAAEAHDLKALKAKWSHALIADTLGLNAILLGHWTEPWFWKPHIVGESVARRGTKGVSARDPPHQVGCWQ